MQKGALVIVCFKGSVPKTMHQTIGVVPCGERLFRADEMAQLALDRVQ